MSEIKHQIEAGDDDVVVETKNKEAMEENYAGEGTGIPNKRDGIGSPVKRAENIASSVKKEDNRRKSSDFWLLWPEPSARATMARFSCFFLHFAINPALRSVGSLSRPTSPPGRSSMWSSTHPSSISKITTFTDPDVSITQAAPAIDSDAFQPSPDLLTCFAPPASASFDNIYLPQGVHKDLQPKPASRSDVKFEDNFKRGLRVRWNGTLAGFNWGERTFYDFTERPAPLFTHFPFTSHNLCLLLQSFKACWVKKLLYQHVCNCVHSYCDVKVENRGCQDLKQGNLSKQL